MENNNNSSEAVFEGPILAAAKIIADISTGIYRSPANALKELVSNSFDAGARQVAINTDHPGFTSVSVYDDGDGISELGIKDVFKYIGGSDKRVGKDVGKFGRPIIGKIGIGILAMSQLSKQFVIISSRRGEDYRIEVEIDISEFETGEAARVNLGEGKIGRYKLYRLPESKENHYTVITTPAGSEVLHNNLREGIAPRDQFVRKSVESDTFYDFVCELNKMPATSLKSYQAFIWELASLTPVPYFDDGPIKGWDGWDEIKKALDSYKFKLIVDGYDIRKPILLPTKEELKDRGDDYEIYPISYSDEELVFDGYIYHQRLQIVPAELQGLLIRIRNVGIMGYDKSLMNYPMNIGPMVRGMTGEIFVHKGLEEALNIDRNSFNETTSHYMKLREVVFSRVGLPGQKEKNISKDVRSRSANRQQYIRIGKQLIQINNLVQRASRISNRKLKLVPDFKGEVPIFVDIENGNVLVNLKHETVPADLAGQKQFFRVLLAVELLDKLGQMSHEKPGLLGWLRRL